MQTVETLNEGLKRAFKITIPAKDINARVDKELKTVAPRIRMPGFRPGKVPPNLVRKMHGAALEQEALNNAIQEGVQQLMADQRIRPAMQPSVALEDHAPGKDAVVNVEVETLPEIPTPKIENLKLERLTVEASDEMVDEQVTRLAAGQKSFDPAPASYAARMGDLVIMDFEGKVDGELFEGGKGEGMSVELGSGRLIPGFEDQLVGAKANEQRTLNVTFPEDYNVDYLKGRPATFDVTVNEVQKPREAQADDEFAKSLGLESMEQLRGLLKGQVEQELNGLTRTHMKRKLLDQLAAAHDFPVPPSMVEAEFQQIWQQLEHEASHEADPAAALAEMEKERDEYHAIAERRVRLGLLLSEIGQANGVDISSQEMNALIAQAAQQYRPADRDKFIQYVRNEPMAAAQLRAPLFEDKVVDLLFSRAEITDRTVSRAELEAEIEGEEGHVHGPGCGHDHDHDHAPAPKAKKGKKAAADAPAAEPKKAKGKAKAAEAPAEETAPAAEEAPAKKPRAKKAAPEEAPAAEEKPAKKARAKKTQG
jgi:trigger factor